MQIGQGATHALAEERLVGDGTDEPIRTSPSRFPATLLTPIQVHPPGHFGCGQEPLVDRTEGQIHGRTKPTVPGGLEDGGRGTQGRSGRRRSVARVDLLKAC